MAPEYRFFQPDFSAPLLQCAALAIALLVPASPARSEIMDLICSDPNQTAVSTRFQIDTDRQSVLATWEGGNNQYNVNSLSDQFIKFSDQPRNDNFSEGTIDRIAGTLIINNTNSSGFIFSSVRMTCRRATQKF